MYTQFEAPDDIRHLVSFFYQMEHQISDGDLQVILPSAVEVNGWQYAGRWRVHSEHIVNEPSVVLPEFYIVGQQTESYRLSAEEEIAGIMGAALVPGTVAAITGQPAYQFTDNPTDIFQLFDRSFVSGYTAAFQGARSAEERLDILINFFRHFNIPQRYEVYKAALQIIFQSKGCITVKELCQKLKVSERYLQREFRSHVGISPLAYLKILRFNNVFAELSKPQSKESLGALVEIFMYYDVSHFNKTHKRYFGVAPTKLV